MHQTRIFPWHVRPPARPSVRSSVRPFVRPSVVCLSVLPFVRPSVRRPSTRPSVCPPPARPSVRPSVCPFDRPSARPSVRQPARQPARLQRCRTVDEVDGKAHQSEDAVHWPAERARRLRRTTLYVDDGRTNRKPMLPIARRAFDLIHRSH